MALEQQALNSTSAETKASLLKQFEEEKQKAIKLAVEEALEEAKLKDYAEEKAAKIKMQEELAI